LPPDCVPPPFIVPLVEPLLIEPAVEVELPIEPAPMVPLVEPLLIEPEVSLLVVFELVLLPLPEPAELFAPRLPDVLTLAPGTFTPMPPLLAAPVAPVELCAMARPEKKSEHASVAAKNFDDIVYLLKNIGLIRPLSGNQPTR
jgi:hypothetical protein